MKTDVHPFGGGVAYVAVFDTETQSAIRRLPGSTRLEQLQFMQISCASVFCIRSDLALDPSRGEEAVETGIMRTFWRDHDGATSVRAMLSLLDGAELIVGYNLFGFDFPVIKKYYSDESMYNAHLNKTHDIFTRCRELLGSWPKLDKLLEVNGLDMKTANGLEAIKMWEDGRREELQIYCEGDVRQAARLGLLSVVRAPDSKLEFHNCVTGIASALAAVRKSNEL
jgi:hypothetical protein